MAGGANSEQGHLSPSLPSSWGPESKKEQESSWKVWIPIPKFPFQSSLPFVQPGHRLAKQTPPHWKSYETSKKRCGRPDPGHALIVSLSSHQSLWCFLCLVRYFTSYFLFVLNFQETGLYLLPEATQLAAVPPGQRHGQDPW